MASMGAKLTRTCRVLSVDARQIADFSMWRRVEGREAAKDDKSRRRRSKPHYAKEFRGDRSCAKGSRFPGAR